MGDEKNPSAKVRRKDGWQNLMTGLGSAKTAKKGFTHQFLEMAKKTLNQWMQPLMRC